MSFFSEQDGVLYAEDIKLQDIAEQYGTPVYVYSKAAFTQHYLNCKLDKYYHKAR